MEKWSTSTGRGPVFARRNSRPARARAAFISMTDSSISRVSPSCTSNEWAGVGAGYPDWMHDFTARMIRDSNGNYMRWMHVAPQKVDVEAFDRFGIVEVSPRGDKEEDAQGRQWEQRGEVMRDTTIYFRNNPSVLFWEAGNTGVTAAQMQQMVDLRREFDPTRPESRPDGKAG